MLYATFYNDTYILNTLMVHIAKYIVHPQLRLNFANPQSTGIKNGMREHLELFVTN